MTRLFERQDLDKLLVNSPPVFTPLFPAGKYSAVPVIEINRSERIASAVQEKSAKLRPSLLPVEGKIEGAKAMEYGTTKYAKNDWRSNENVTRESLLDALERHLQALHQGETHAPDSQVHHLGHIIAGASMILARFGK